MTRFFGRSFLVQKTAVISIPFVLCISRIPSKAEENDATCRDLHPRFN
jgi:hypothetical protein